MFFDVLSALVRHHIISNSCINLLLTNETMLAYGGDIMKTTVWRLTISVAWAYLLATGGSASADTITPETSTISVQNYSQTESSTTTGPNSVSLSGGTGTVVVSPSVNVQSSIDDSQDASLAGAQGVTTFMDYYFEVIGGTPGTPVPVLVQTTLSTSQTGVNSYGFAEIDVGPTSEETVCSGPNCTLSSSQLQRTCRTLSRQGQRTKFILKSLRK